MQSSSAFASSMTPADRVGVGEHRLPDDRGRGARPSASSASAICCGLVGDLAQVSAPYRSWLPVRNQTCWRVAGACGHRAVLASVLAVDVLVAVVERVDRRPAAIGIGSPSWRAMCTVRATSSTHHGGLDRVAGVRADGERAVVLHQHGRGPAARAGSRRCRGRSSRRRSARTGRPGSSPPNSSAIIVSTHGIGFAAGGPRAWRRWSGCARRRRPRACAGRRRRARRCRRTGASSPSTTVAVEVA